MEKYDIQTVEVKDNDVILLKVSDSLDLDNVNNIYKEVSKAFPKNKILIVNHHILEDMTILRPKSYFADLDNNTWENDYDYLYRWERSSN